MTPYKVVDDDSTATFELRRFVKFNDDHAVTGWTFPPTCRAIFTFYSAELDKVEIAGRTYVVVAFVFWVMT